MMIMKEKDDDDGYTRRVSGLDLSVVVVKTALDFPPFSPLTSHRRLPHFHLHHLRRHLMPA